MLNYLLSKEPDGSVYYIMKQEHCAVANKMPLEAALAILNRGGTVHVSQEYGGFPITSDDVYFFCAEYDEDEHEVVLGEEGVPIPAKGVRKSKKRIKDVVCE